MVDPNRPESAIERRAAMTHEDIDARTQREVVNLKEIIDDKFESLQREVDRRLVSTSEAMRLEVARYKEGLAGERDHALGMVRAVEARLDGMDRANVVLQETVTRVPTDVQLQVGNLQDVMVERFNSIDKQFSERDIRSEREARDNKVAVDAAFAAQKEAAARQDESNAKAIDKSENATKETINKLNDLLEALNKALSGKIDDGLKTASDKIDDLKARVTAIEAARISGREQVADHRAGMSTTTALIVAAIGFLTFLVLTVSMIAAVTHGFK